MASLCFVVTGHSYSRIAAPEIEMRLQVSRHILPSHNLVANGSSSEKPSEKPSETLGLDGTLSRIVHQIMWILQVSWPEKKREEGEVSLALWAAKV